jgi:thymidylate synthase
MEPFSTSDTTKSFDENVANKAALPCHAFFQFYVATASILPVIPKVPTSF